MTMSEPLDDCAHGPEVTLDETSAQVGELIERIQELQSALNRLHTDNERLRWRHETVIPEWGDLPKKIKDAIIYECGAWRFGLTTNSMAVNLWSRIREQLATLPEPPK